MSVILRVFFFFVLSSWRNSRVRDESIVGGNKAREVRGRDAERGFLLGNFAN